MAQLPGDEEFWLRILNPGEKDDSKRMLIHVLKSWASTSSRTRKNFFGVL